MAYVVSLCFCREWIVDAVGRLAIELGGLSMKCVVDDKYGGDDGYIRWQALMSVLDRSITVKFVLGGDEC